MSGTDRWDKIASPLSRAYKYLNWSERMCGGRQSSRALQEVAAVTRLIPKGRRVNSEKSKMCSGGIEVEQLEKFAELEAN